jgi:hypothetical protein
MRFPLNTVIYSVFYKLYPASPDISSYIGFAVS